MSEKPEKSERTLVSFDWALKSILRQKDNFDILEGFLSDLLNENITIIDLLESEGNKSGEKDKSNRVDLRAKDQLGREIIIEVQYSNEPDYLERLYYGVAKSLVDSMQEGFRYKKVKKIISVSIAYWKLLEKNYIARGIMRFEDLNGVEIPNVKRAKDIFAEYYLIQPVLFDDDIQLRIDEWVYMFKHSKIKGKINATNLDKAHGKFDIMRMTAAEKRIYDEYQLNKTIYEGELQVKLEEGLQKGKKEGMEQGIEQGKQAMIDAMRANGFSEEEIERIAGSVSNEKERTEEE